MSKLTKEGSRVINNALFREEAIHQNKIQYSVKQSFVKVIVVSIEVSWLQTKYVGDHMLYSFAKGVKDIWCLWKMFATFAFLFLPRKTKVEDKKGCSQLSLLFVSRKTKNCVKRPKKKKDVCNFGFFFLNSLRKQSVKHMKQMLTTFTSIVFLTCYGNNLGEDMKETCNFHFLFFNMLWKQPWWRHEGNLQLSLLLVGRNEMRRKHVEQDVCNFLELDQKLCFGELF